MQTTSEILEAYSKRTSNEKFMEENGIPLALLILIKLEQIEKLLQTKGKNV